MKNTWEELLTEIGCALGTAKNEKFVVLKEVETYLKNALEIVSNLKWECIEAFEKSQGDWK